MSRLISPSRPLLTRADMLHALNIMRKARQSLQARHANGQAAIDGPFGRGLQEGLRLAMHAIRMCYREALIRERMNHVR